MLGSKRRIVYRSWFRFLWSVQFGVSMATAGIGGTMSGDVAAIVFVPVGLFVVSYAVWPRLVLNASGLSVRNVGTTALAWSECNDHAWKRQTEDQPVSLTIRAPPQPGTGPSSCRHILIHQDAVILSPAGAQQLAAVA